MYQQTLDMGQFEDEYREALLGRIQAKVNGTPIEDTPVAAPEPALDLVDALMASINAEKAKTEAPAADPAPAGSLGAAFNEFSSAGVN
jgi:non-homologous end joining protein Ku